MASLFELGYAEQQSPRLRGKIHRTRKGYGAYRSLPHLVNAPLAGDGRSGIMASWLIDPWWLGNAMVSVQPHAPNP